MAEPSSALDPRVSLAIYAMAATVMIAVILGLAYVVRARSGPDRFGIYESGAPTGRAIVAPTAAAFFQIAAFFVIFDYEAAVLYSWALSAADAGWGGLASAALFIFVLLAALYYLWADGALDTGPETRTDETP